MMTTKDALTQFVGTNIKMFLNLTLPLIKSFLKKKLDLNSFFKGLHVGSCTSFQTFVQCILSRGFEK